MKKLHLLSIFLAILLLASPANAGLKAVSSSGNGLPTPVVNGDCIIGSGGVPVWGACSGSASANLGTSLSAVSPQIAGDATSGFYTAGAGKVDAAVGGAKIGEWSSTGYAVTGVLSASGHVTFEGVTSTGATGTGALVFATSPTLVTPVLGAATGTSLNLSAALTATHTIATATDADTLPVGTVGQRPGSPTEGMIRENSTSTATLEAYVAGAWQTISTGAAGLVNLVTGVTGILPIPNGGNTFNVVLTNAPYNASGFIAQTTTTSSVAAGIFTVPVVSSAGFNIGHIGIVSLGGTSGIKNFAGFISAIPDSTHITFSATAVSGASLPGGATSGTSGIQATSVPSGYTVYEVGSTQLASSVTTGACVLPLSNAASYATGQGIYVTGGAVSGALVSTISSVSGNNVTINPCIGNASGTSSGSNVQHDDTAAFQLAVNLLTPNQNVSIFLPDGYYQVNGTNGSTYLGGNGVAIQLPNIPYYNSGLTIWRPQATLQISGNVPAPQEQSYVAGARVVHMSGAIIATAQNTPNNPPPQVFAGGASGSLNGISNIQTVIQNLTLRLPIQPSIAGFNFAQVESLKVYSVDIDTGDPGPTSQPSNNQSQNYAIVMPTGENGGNNVISNVQIQGTYWGINAAEHSRLQHVRLDAVFWPIIIGASNSIYGVSAVDVECNGTPHCIGASGSNPVPIDFSLLNIEHQSTPSWVATVNDIQDTSNILTGQVALDYNVGLTPTITVSNAINLHVVNARSASYPFPTQVFADFSNTHFTSAPNGVVVFCSDCTPTAVAAGSGTGAYCERLNGAWACNGSGVAYAALGVSQTFTAGQAVTPVTTTLTVGTNTPDFSASNDLVATFGAGNATFGAPSNIKAGQHYTITLIQDGVGSRTMTWNAAFKWPGGTAPTLSTGAGLHDAVGCDAETTSRLNCSSNGTNFQ